MACGRCVYHPPPITSLLLSVCIDLEVSWIIFMTIVSRNVICKGYRCNTLLIFPLLPPAEVLSLMQAVFLMISNYTHKLLFIDIQFGTQIAQVCFRVCTRPSCQSYRIRNVFSLL